MRVLQPQQQESFASRTDAAKTIHLWRRSDHAICGSDRANHDCRGADGQFIHANFLEQTVCPGCGRPLCALCSLLAVTPLNGRTTQVIIAWDESVDAAEAADRSRALAAATSEQEGVVSTRIIVRRPEPQPGPARVRVSV